VKDFGAVGNGITDDYDAIKNAAAAICAAPAGSSLVYPPGRYRIARHKVDAGPLKNSVTDITYSNCRSVSITGYGAVIDIEGNFRRTWDFTLAAGGWKMSFHNGVVPFRFVDSSGFTVAGFELDGNVDQMTRDADVIETSSAGTQNAGILTFRSSNYVLKDLNIHHFHTDGLLLGFDPIADRNVYLDSVQSRNNGRNALSILQMKGATILNSQFANSGRTGPYGFHMPAAGVDIEPEFTVVSSPAADVNTGDIYFKQCTFSENIGWQYVNAYALRVGAVSVSRASVIATLADSSYQALAFTNGSSVSITEDSDLRIAAGKNVHLPPPGADLPMPTHSTYRANTFRLSRNDGILADQAKSRNIDFVENVVNVSAAAPDSTYMWLRGLRTVRSNTFYVDRAGFAAAGAAHYVILTEGTTLVAQNEYSTNLATSGKFYAPVYSSSAWGNCFGAARSSSRPPTGTSLVPIP
jgi:hypothetical protein